MLNLPYPLLLDGGFATELEDRFQKDLSGKLWSAKCLIEDPESIKAVHLAYFEAGSNIATTCSYQATLPGFMSAGYNEVEAEVAMRRSVQLAVAAREEYRASHANDVQPRLVALSVGCYGAYLAGGQEYTGDYGNATVDDLVCFHQHRLDILLQESGIDFILFETVPSRLEAEAISKLVHRYRKDKDGQFPPVCVSFSCQSEDRISDGTPLLEALEVLQSSGADGFEAVGVNCTKMTYIPSLVSLLVNWNKARGLATLVYPDGGQVWNAEARGWVPNTKLPPSDFASNLLHCLQKYDSKMFLIGGCCGVGPDHIRALRENAKTVFEA
ncbi:Homocysteine S-methyltransferase [Hesseltinella vesiculosa]|uniref:Homocysteine S-methyltransferase n=1 Tax=Hesseltinella vesiculosa TaxID=101127 RepID=A0A1X2G5G4_9FUNG|nr:Homocysteine S-methyltransferase [Hesseltinella vesiculosa]